MNIEIIIMAIGAIVSEYGGLAFLILVIAGYFLLSRPDQPHTSIEGWGRIQAEQKEPGLYEQYLQSDEWKNRPVRKIEPIPAPEKINTKPESLRLFVNDAEYKKYIHSPLWTLRSRSYREQCKGICEKCKKEVGISGLVTHHKRYIVNLEKNDTSENWWALCRSCHNAIPKMHLPKRKSIAVTENQTTKSSYKSTTRKYEVWPFTTLD